MNRPTQDGLYWAKLDDNEAWPEWLVVELKDRILSICGEGEPIPLKALASWEGPIPALRGRRPS